MAGFLKFVLSFLSRDPFHEFLYTSIVDGFLENKVLMFEGRAVSPVSSLPTVLRKLKFLSTIVEFYS